MKPRYVIDAAFVLDALLTKQEEAVVLFLHLVQQAEKGKIELFAGSSLKERVGEALMLAGAESETLTALIRVFYQLPITYQEPTEIQVKHAVRMSREAGVPLHLTLLHVMALALGGVFVTCDRTYYKKMESRGALVLGAKA